MENLNSKEGLNPIIEQLKKDNENNGNILNENSTGLLENEGFNNQGEKLSKLKEEIKIKEKFLEKSKDISEKIDLFDINYVKDKFKKRFKIEIDNLGETFTNTEINGKYKYKINFQKLNLELSESDLAVFNNLRTLYILLLNKVNNNGEEGTNNKIGISLSGSGGNAPVHFGHLQKMEENDGINLNNISIIGSSGGALVAIMYSLAKTYHPELSAKEIYEQFYPKDLSNGFDDGASKLNSFKNSFNKILSSETGFSKLKFSDLKIPVIINFRSGYKYKSIAGGDMLIEPYLASSIDIFKDIEINSPFGKMDDVASDPLSISPNSSYPYKVLNLLGYDNSNIIISSAIRELLLYNHLDLYKEIPSFKGVYSSGEHNTVKIFNDKKIFDNSYINSSLKDKIQKELNEEKEINELVKKSKIEKGKGVFPYKSFLNRFDNTIIDKEKLKSMINESYSQVTTNKGKILYSFKINKRICLYDESNDIYSKGDSLDEVLFRYIKATKDLDGN